MSTIAVPAPRARGRSTPLRVELRAMLQLAAPLAAVQLGQILIHGTEVVLLGRLGPVPLAAVTIAWTLFYAGFIFVMGVAQATAPLIAEALGAGRPEDERRVVRHGLLVAVLMTLPIIAVLWHGGAILVALGQDPGLSELAQVYLRDASPGLVAAAALIVLRNWASAHGRTLPVLAITWLVFVVNIPVSAALTFGLFGLPRLEVLGAGLGAAGSWTVMTLLLLAWSCRARGFRERRVLADLGLPRLAMMLAIVRLGLPIGAAMLLETTLFAVSALMMGRIGAAELAAHQVSLQLAATTFMVPLGISIAATLRIGLAVGAGDADGVRRAGWVATALGAAFMTSTALLFAFEGDRLTSLFFDPADPAADTARAVAARLILVAALFQLVDGLQVIGIAALRGLRDTTIPMALAAFGYIAVGIPACAALGFLTPLGPFGIWLGLALALAIVAAVMLWRFARLTAPGVLDSRLAREIR